MAFLPLVIAFVVVRSPWVAKLELIGLNTEQRTHCMLGFVVVAA